MRGRRAGLVIAACLAMSARPVAGAPPSALPEQFRYQILFPQAPADGLAARLTLSQRVEAVTRFMACGHEIDFLHHFTSGDPSNRSTEDFLAPILAKLAWLQNMSGPCTQTVQIAAKDLEPAEVLGSFIGPPGQPSRLAPDLAQDRLNRQMKAAYGGRCIDNLVTQYRNVPDAGYPDGIWEVDIAVSPECLRRQVNEGLKKVEIFGLLGSSGVPCSGVAGIPGTGGTTNGEWDVAVRDLTRIFYIDRGYEAAHPGGGFLDSDVRVHVQNDLLSVSGPLGDADYSLHGCGNQEQSTGTPQDLADERAFGDEFWDAVGDFLNWLLHLVLFVSALGIAIGVAASVPGGALASIIAGPAIAAYFVSYFVRIPETENHRLMIETSRYLKNQIIIEALGPGYSHVDDFVEDQKEIKVWLLGRLQSFVVGDFIEYNARPYQRYSINAILNLFDFAADDELRTASRMALEYANAKFAVGSLHGRRIVPFRRLLEHIRADYEEVGLSGTDSAGNPRPTLLFDLYSGGDHQIAQMLLFAGQTQQLPVRAPGRLASIPSAAAMIYAATSGYRPPDLIVDLAIRKSSPIYQRIHHFGWEVYSSGSSYLLSAGGVQTPPSAAVLGFSNDNDRGVAMPTTLMLAVSGGLQDRNRFIRIEGTKHDYGSTGYSFDDNLCVWKGFACGVNIQIPIDLQGSALTPGCLKAEPPGATQSWSFLDSLCVDPAAPRAFVAIYRQACQFVADCNYGIVEVVDASPTEDFSVFRTKVLANNPPGFIPTPTAPVPSIHGVYHSLHGDVIDFDCAAHQVSLNRWGIESVNGAPTAGLGAWPGAEGDAITTTRFAPSIVGLDVFVGGTVEIRNALMGKALELDFTEVGKPKRTER